MSKLLCIKLTHHIILKHNVHRVKYRAGLKRRSYQINLCDLVKEIQQECNFFTVPESELNECLRTDSWTFDQTPILGYRDSIGHASLLNLNLNQI